VTYNFQDDRFTLSIYRCVGERDVGVPSQPPRQGYFDHYLSYSDQAGFETFKRILQQTLDAAAPKKKSAFAATAENPGPATLERWAHYKGALRHICITFDEGNNAEFYVDGAIPKAIVLARENASGKYLLQFTPDCSADYRRGFLAALSFFDGGDGFQVAESFGEGQVPDAVMLLVPNQDNATYSVRGDGNVEFESTGAVI
jgi:hypothetical protein